MCANGVGLSEPRLAPDGHAVAYVAVVAGRPELVVARLDRGSARIVTTEPVPAAAPAYGGGAFDWTPDGGALVCAARDGDLWRVDADGGPPRRLTAHGPGARAAAPSVSPDGHRVAYVVDQRDAAVMALDGSWPVRLSADADFCLDPAWTADGTRVVWHEWDIPNMPWDESRLVSRRADGSGEVEVLYDLDDTAVQQPRPAPVGTAVAFVSDESGWANVVVLDAGNTARRVLDDPHEHAGPTWAHGQRSVAWSPDGTQLAIARNEDGFGRLVIVDLTSGVERALGRGVHGSLSWVGDRLAALRSGARTPTEIVVYDIVTGGRISVAVGPVARTRARHGSWARRHDIACALVPAAARCGADRRGGTDGLLDPRRAHRPVGSDVPYFQARGGRWSCPITAVQRGTDAPTRKHCAGSGVPSTMPTAPTSWPR